MIVFGPMGLIQPTWPDCSVTTRTSGSESSPAAMEASAQPSSDTTIGRRLRRPTRAEAMAQRITTPCAPTSSARYTKVEAPSQASSP